MLALFGDELITTGKDSWEQDKDQNDGAYGTLRDGHANFSSH